MTEGIPETPFEPDEGRQIADNVDQALTARAEHQELIENPFDWEEEKAHVRAQFLEAGDDTPLELIAEPHVGAYNTLQCAEALRQTEISPYEYAQDHALPTASQRLDWTGFMSWVTTGIMVDELLQDPEIQHIQAQRTQENER